jgi:hypothetical protein
MLYGGRDSVGESMAAIGKGKQCQSIEALSGGKEIDKRRGTVPVTGRAPSGKKIDRG